MTVSTLPATPTLEEFPIPPDLGAAGFDESLLYDPAKYEAHKARQLNRPAPAAAGAAIPLASDDSWQPPAALQQRRSHRRFDPAPIAAASFSRALRAFRQTREGGEVKALYPSTGGLYAIDVYLHVKSGRVDGVPGGIHYYDPRAHALRPVAAETALGRDIHHHQNRPIFAGSAFTLIFVFNADVTAPVYGAASHHLACIEAGIILATFNHVAETLGLGLCPVGLVDFASVSTALSLPARHSVVHLAECGAKPAATAASADPEPSSELSVAGLRRFLAATLPDYMVPSQFIVVDEIPVTPNNKIDREALLKLGDNGALALGTEFVGTETEIEARLQAIWQKVIRVERIGAEDNFFDLGGDSMGVAEVRQHIADEWQLDVPILKLFQYPTIRTAARFLKGLLAVPPAGHDARSEPAEVIELGSPCNDVAPASDADREALAWLRAHPGDPRADAVAARLRLRGLQP